MREFLGLGEGDRCLGFFVAGIAPPEVVAGYRGARKDWREKVTWKE
jgi:hypothetical protein